MFSNSETLLDEQGNPVRYNKIKVGPKNLKDAVLNLDNLGPNYPSDARINKASIYRAIVDKDYNEMRRISNTFYNLNGIYRRVCDYIAYLYRYDWYIAAEVYDDNAKEEKIVKDFGKVLTFFDRSYVKKLCGEIAGKVARDGCYYGYIIDDPRQVVIQQLPIEYCRVRYFVGNKPAVEFNMRFFDTFTNTEYRNKVLKLFPAEFEKGYRLYHQNKLVETDNVSSLGTWSNLYDGWYLLDPDNTVKFNINNSDVPFFFNAIPALINLEEAQGLERKRQMQKLLKIIVQKLPLDKNSELVFDVDEARDIHNNAVEMLADCIGVDVLTTFTDVDSIDLSDATTSNEDNVESVERSAYDALGISRNIFNTDGNLSLEKSILNDESTVRSLLFQFNVLMDRIIERKNSNIKKYNFKFTMLETTQYNYQALAKLYKEHMQNGASKLLPQIALGHSQSFILNSIHFENEVLHLSEIMIPPLMSSTMNSEDILGKKTSSSDNKNQNTVSGKSTAETKEAGRPEKDDSEKSDKTIANKESMS